ncbi:hypothetical protein KAZ01_00625 [Candidatus Gracilibacteria bacterium]|nr:hypothetical protein [Candidatus Gracilibacteria bacterium]
MKKIFILLLFSIYFLHNIGSIFANNCEYNSDASLQGSLSSCIPKGSLETKTTGGGTSLLGGLITIGGTSNQGYSVNEAKNKILSVTQKIVILGFIAAIGGIVFSGILFVVGLGNTDKIKKAKDALKWSLIGLIAIITAQIIVNVLINFIYSIGGS